MSAALGGATGATFTWLGMVLAISFLETPLKFRAPDVTIAIGLGIGRLVFRALNTVELVLAVVLAVATALGNPPGRVIAAVACVIVILAVQLGVVRPRLNRRSERVLSGVRQPRSRGHHAYVVLEVAKVVALVTTGVLLLAG